MTLGTAGDSGVPAGDRLVAFADAVVIAGSGDLANAREALRAELGPDALVDAAAVVASFNSVVRIADASGIPIEECKREAVAGIVAELGLDSAAAKAPRRIRRGRGRHPQIR